MSDGLRELVTEVERRLIELLAHGHGKLEVEVDTNAPGRRRVVIRMGKESLRYVEKDEVEQART